MLIMHVDLREGPRIAHGLTVCSVPAGGSAGQVELLRAQVTTNGVHATPVSAPRSPSLLWVEQHMPTWSRDFDVGQSADPHALPPATQLPSVREREDPMSA